MRLLVLIGFLAITTTIITVTTYVIYTNQNIYSYSKEIEELANEYNDAMMRSVSSKSILKYGIQFMLRYDIFNTTIKDFTDLSGTDPFSSGNIFNGMRLLYNISKEDVPRYEKRMSILTNKDVKLIDLNNDTSTSPVLMREFYCPIFFVVPINPSTYIPGIDFCNIDTTQPLLYKIRNSRIGSFVTQSRKSVFINSTFLDVAVKLNNGFVLLVLNVDNIINQVFRVEDKVIIFDSSGVEFYNNCQDCDKSNKIDKKVFLSNGDYIEMFILFRKPPIDIKFIFALAAMLILSFSVIWVFTYSEGHKRKYKVANKMLVM